MAADKVYGSTGLPTASTSGESGYSRSISASTMSLPASVKEVGERLSDLAHQVQGLQNERDDLCAQIERFKDCHRQLLFECGRDVEEGMKRLVDESEEDSNVCGQCEQPQSARLLSNELQSLGEYLRRQESSEKTFVSGGRCIRTPSGGMTGASKGSLVIAEECSERVSEREDMLDRQVAELQTQIDELTQQLAKACNMDSEAELSSDTVCESLSRVEEAALIRSQSVPEKLLTAHKKIEVLEEIYDNLLAEKKETESTLEASLKTVQSLDESLEEERLEKFVVKGEVKQLKTKLESLKELVSKKPVQKAKGSTHTCSPPRHTQGEGLQMCKVKTLQTEVARVTGDSKKANEDANHARQERREMKDQLDRTLAEKLLLEEEVERLMREKADVDQARQERREMKDQLDRTLAEKLQLEEEVEGLTRAKTDAHRAYQERREMKDQLDHTVAEKHQLEEKIEGLSRAKADVDRARQERREMKDQLDRTVAEKLLLQDEVEDQKQKAREWKMKLDETTGRLILSEEQLQQMLGGRQN